MGSGTMGRQAPADFGSLGAGAWGKPFLMADLSKK